MIVEHTQLEAYYPMMVQWRRYLHQHPELSFHEQETAAYVYACLQSLGLQPKKYADNRAIVVDLVGNQPGPTVALRADMDALAIQDEKKVAYASSRKGVMHACGHDGHTSALLGVAQYFAAHKLERGRLRLIFQHAEEICPGGALTLIEEGVLQEVDVIYGVHLWTMLPLGTMAISEGSMMAAADEFAVEICGKGGHGGLPHEAVDSVAIAAHTIVNLQSIISRKVNPLETAVISVGSIHAGESFNVIPETCRIRGTVRTMDEKVRQQVRHQFETVCHQSAQMYGATANVDYIMGYPTLINDQTEARRAIQVARGIAAFTDVQDNYRVMAGEDFSYYVERVPGAFVFIGAGNPDVGAIYPHHHPRFDFDEHAMIHAATLLVNLVEDYMVASCS